MSRKANNMNNTADIRIKLMQSSNKDNTWIKRSIEIINALLEVEHPLNNSVFIEIEKKIDYLNSLDNSVLNKSIGDAIKEKVKADYCEAIYLKLSEYKSRIALAKKTKISFDGETYLGIGTIIVSIILLAFSIITIKAEGANYSWFDKANADTTSMFVSGVVMSVAGIFFIIHLIRGRAEKSDAKEILNDAGIKPRSLMITIKDFFHIGTTISTVTYTDRDTYDK